MFPVGSFVFGCCLLRVSSFIPLFYKIAPVPLAVLPKSRTMTIWTLSLPDGHCSIYRALGAFIGRFINCVHIFFMKHFCRSQGILCGMAAHACQCAKFLILKDMAQLLKGNRHGNGSKEGLQGLNALEGNGFITSDFRHIHDMKGKTTEAGKAVLIDIPGPASP